MFTRAGFWGRVLLWSVTLVKAGRETLARSSPLPHKPLGVNNSWGQPIVNKLPPSFIIFIYYPTLTPHINATLRGGTLCLVRQKTRFLKRVHYRENGCKLNGKWISMKPTYKTITSQWRLHENINASSTSNNSNIKLKTLGSHMYIFGPLGLLEAGNSRLIV
jgi:hypothetical protein